MSEPRVSVIIPTYNYAEVLPYSIGSVLWQSFEDFELLVVGDGCTDASEEVVRQIDDPRVRWFNLPCNTGNASGPNNEGLRRARGELIAYLGHDDLWLPNHLAPLVEAIDKGADFAYATAVQVDGDGSRHLYPLRPLVGPPGISPSQILHTAAIAAKAGPWRGPHELTGEQDDDFFGRIHEAGCLSRFVPHISGVKLDAARRKNVYKERPVHEQRYWTEQIRRGAILEIIDLREEQSQRLLRRTIKRLSVGDAARALARALLRWPRQQVKRMKRRAQRGSPAANRDKAIYAGSFDWSEFDEAERKRRYRELYDQRRDFKGLAPLATDTETSTRSE
jgi:glycosyltransferase involved in cell wall biosynthesis